MGDTGRPPLARTRAPVLAHRDAHAARARVDHERKLARAHAPGVGGGTIEHGVDDLQLDEVVAATGRTQARIADLLALGVTQPSVGAREAAQLVAALELGF